MRMLHLTGLALAISAGMALPLAGSAKAAMGGALPSTQILPVEQAQFYSLATTSVGTTTAGRARAGTGATTPGTPATVGAAAKAGTGWNYGHRGV